MKSSSKYKHFKSKTHSCSKNSDMKTYVILKLKLDEVDELLGKYVINYNKKNAEYDVRCLLELLTTTNRVRHVKIISTNEFALLTLCS